MNYIKHLTGFFEKVIIDKTLNPTHISLYIALFQFWNCNRFKNPISINRDELMRISKISSKATYHKCLRNLHELEYINYQPSYNPFKGSHVIMFNFSENLKPATKSERTPLIEPVFKPSTEQVMHKSVTNPQTGNEQAMVPSINNTNTTNNLKIENSLNESQHPQKSIQENVAFELEDFEEKEKKLREKKKVWTENQSETKPYQSPIINHFILPGLVKSGEIAAVGPTIQEVQQYFQKESFPDVEAQKFFNYFESIGWLVGGRTPMQNWKAAAQNWMINSINFKDNTSTSAPNRPQHLNTTTDKNYAEPL